MKPWKKKFLPRTLYFRAAAIFLLPIITVFVAITVVFFQRHFEGVTEQLTKNVVSEVRIIQGALETDTILNVNARYGEAFSMKVSLAETPLEGTLKSWIDVTALTLVPILENDLKGFAGIDLRRVSDVDLFVASPKGTLKIEMPRGRFSPRNPHQLLVWMFGTGGFITLIAFFFLRNQLRPMKRLSAAADAFGRGEILDFSPGGALEVRAAGQAFLDMRDRIERQIEQRTLLLSGVSHDLRTPLTRLQLGLEMLDGPEKAELQKDVQEMQVMVDGFLDFSRGVMGEETENTDICATILNITDRWDNAHFETHLQKFDAKVRPMAFHRSISNLVENALQYGQEAFVSLHVSDHAFRVVVEDNGAGISEQDLDKATRPFVRLDPARNQNKGSGVGLGLAIVKDMVRAHGGTLKLGKSERHGGLKAEVEFPVHQQNW